MVKNTNLVIQNDLAADIALSTLAARTALQVSAQFVAITATFLMKRVKYFLKLEGVTSGEGPYLVGLARGDMSAGEISAALVERNTSGPGDTTQSLTEDVSFSILQNSVRMLGRNGKGDGVLLLEAEIPLGKGIPWAEGTGWQLFVFNAGNAALTTGAIIAGIAQYWGVWLRD